MAVLIKVYGDSGVDPEEANSYGAMSEANTYFANRFNFDWAAVPSKEAALIKATAYLDQHYRKRWAGKRATQEQALAWPRTDVVDEDGFDIDETTIPQAVKDACFELALRSNSDALQRDYDPSNPAVIAQSDSVGPISTSVTYDAPYEGRQPEYRQIDDILSGLIVGSSYTHFISRA